ncbi:uncharacterized protein LOC114843099 [Betta splendens]|uniref:Uncharacterized protein LOC114843099 n=1 Tax=Betta splendens TaxID=158456 RepID=A0A9W2XBB7_BETSP|nr:uncharacterized protein LOC114843099 [Betta splendens]
MNKTPITYRQEKSHMGSMERSFTDQSTLQEDERMALSFMDAHTCGTRIIPCKFRSEYQIRKPDHVVWYQYERFSYPKVYDKYDEHGVIREFKRRTSRDKLEKFQSCSLQIFPVESHDDRRAIYPWIDPDNVGKFTHRFFDKTVTIEVHGTAEKPHVTIVGDKKVGKTVEVQCSVDHTCSTYPPTLEFNFPLVSPSQSNYCWPDGSCRKVLKSTLNITTERQTVMCTVTHHGGPTASTSLPLNAQCSFSSLTISPTSVEFLEGQASSVTCTASYTCSKDQPVLTWNYNSMPASTSTQKVGDTQWNTVSTLTFTASATDNGKSMRCYAKFQNGQRQEASISLRVKRSMLALGWSFTTPSSLTAMRGSCIIIPCSFTYSKSQPINLRVIWYLFQSNQYPAVYDQRQAVTAKFNGLTSLIGSFGERNCSLKIESLEMNHNGDRLYPWIDEHPITSYHLPDGRLSDKTTQLIVTNKAQEPQLSTIGVPRVGEQGRVSCSVHHTCITSPPILTLSGISGEDVFMDSLVSNGMWQRTIERTWKVQETDQSVTCTVSYSGGQKAKSELVLKVECPYEEIKMLEPPGELTEGMAKSVLCSVTYTCRKNKPNIVWNFKDMQYFLNTQQLSSNTYNVESNLTFIGSLNDNGKPLTCTAQFVTGNTSASKVLQVKKYDLYDPTDFEESRETPSRVTNVPHKLTALTRSCVVIPCSFQLQEELFTRGIWSKKSGGVIFHNGRSQILNHFKDRTRLIGDLSEGNCSLEIDNIKPFDNGPFCFHAQKDNVNHRFINNCVFIVMKASPDKPQMSPVPAEVDAGSVLTVSCSVTHTCSSHPPNFSWSVQNLSSEVTHSSAAQGIWTTTSSIKFKVATENGVKSLTCTATFWRGIEQGRTVELKVKGSMMYKLKSSLPTAIPVSLIVVVAVIMAAVFGVPFYKKRMQAHKSLVPPPRPEKRRSLWYRLSRTNAEVMDRPPRPEKRRSIWSRLSGNQDNANHRVFYQTNTAAVSYDYDYDNKMTKPRFPSPKNNRRNPHWPEVSDKQDTWHHTLYYVYNFSSHVQTEKHRTLQNLDIHKIYFLCKWKICHYNTKYNPTQNTTVCLWYLQCWC